MELRALSYNVHKLFDITGRKYFLSALKDVLSNMNLDFVFLQEVPGLLPGSHKDQYDSDPIEHLADQLWDHFVYGKNAISTNQNHGNAILSKYPFVHSENFDISNHRLEQRGFLLGKTQIDGKSLVLGSTHLDLTMVGRNRQVKKIKQTMHDFCDSSMPMLICGDFNDWDGQTSKKMQAQNLETWEIGPTFPSFYPVLPLDRIFFRNLSCIKAEALKDKHWKNLSDHLPMYVEFMLDE